MTSPLNTVQPDLERELTWSGRDVAELLTLERDADGAFRNRQVQINGNGAIFGGQLIGQCLYAAGAALKAFLPAHHLQLTFLAPGLTNQPLRFEVKRLLTGRRFVMQHVLVTQGDRTVVSANVSFHAGESGPQSQVPMPADVPAPDTLVPLRDAARRHADRLGNTGTLVGSLGGIDFRPLDPERLLFQRDPQAALRYWVRIDHNLVRETLVHQAALGFISDYWLPLAAVFPHVGLKVGSGLYIASLNHSLWFHRPVQADDWLFVDAQSPWSGDSRGLTVARVYDRERQLVATVAQEGLYRGWIEADASFRAPGVSS